jgi:hypothetical protein
MIQSSKHGAAQMPSVNTSLLQYKKDTLTLVGLMSEMPFNGFPKSVLVRSHHTGNLVEFVYDERLAERNEWWDGEEAHYKSNEPRANAQYLVLVNN